MDSDAKDKTPVIIDGTVENIVFRNDANGFTVFSVIPAGKSEQRSLFEDDELTCTGCVPEITPGETVKVAGSYVNNPKYGRQLAVTQLEKAIPNTVEGIEKYLGSGVIKGIGERMAKKIVTAFGKHTFEIIEQAPERLTAVKGINLDKAMKIAEAFHSQASLRRAMMFLQDYGISPVYAMKIYKQYQERTIEVVKNNPYKLADDIDGIGFTIADDIARKAGIALDSPFRIAAGARYCLWDAANNGHVYLPKAILLEQASQMLVVEPDMVDDQLMQMQMDKLIYQERIEDGNNETAVFLSVYYNAELHVARKLFDLAATVTPDANAELLSQAIQEHEQAADITLANEQRKAVVEAMSNGTLIITGGPGTGKTTTINTIISLLSARQAKIELAAPTGRAAKRMTEATGREARTLHRLLETTFLAEDSRKQTFQRNEEKPIEADVVIVDEISMVDILLMQSLLKAIVPGTRLIMVGDADQLPSVGPGNVLKDMIHSECLPVVRLTEIFRQAQESAIVMNAHRINRGEYPVLNEKSKDFFFMRRGDIESVTETILDLITRRLPGYIRNKQAGIPAWLQDIQVLTPMRKSPLGVINLNQILQRRLNPPSPEKKERDFRSVTFREGDKVMQIKNNYTIDWMVYEDNNRKRQRTNEGEGVFNGDGGVITGIDEASEIMTVLFDDNRQVDYNFSQLDELELAYAITIHKSQGSEYPVVVLPIHSGPPMLMSRNLLYTAVTRAKSLVVVVGVPDTLYRMVDNNREENRYTALTRRLRAVFG